MAHVVITAPLKRYTDSLESMELDGGTVGEVLQHLAARYPGMGEKLFRDDGTLRAHFIIYLDGRDIRMTEGLTNKVRRDSTIKLYAALAGG